MSLVNNALTTPPVNRSPHKVTLGSIGLTTRAIQMSATNNPEGLNPDAFNMMMENNSLEAWWICLPTEIHQSALCPVCWALLADGFIDVDHDVVCPSKSFLPAISVEDFCHLSMQGEMMLVHQLLAWTGGRNLQQI